MGKKGKTVGGGMLGPGKSIISGGHGVGKYGQPHKFYDKSMAKYKGPHKELKDLSGDGKITKKDVLIGRGELEGPKKMSGESYDMKQAYNKDLTKGARFNYLKNALHDKGGMSKYKAEGPGKMKKDKQKISKLQDDVLAGSAKYNCGK